LKFLQQNAYNSRITVDILIFIVYNIYIKQKGVDNVKSENDVRVTIRVEKELKKNAENLFERLGMNMSTALNVFLRKAVDESAIPFAISLKDTSFGYGYSSNDVTNAFKEAVQDEIIEKKRNGFPVAKYDINKKQAYLENFDGTREYIY